MPLETSPTDSSPVDSSPGVSSATTSSPGVSSPTKRGEKDAAPLHPGTACALSIAGSDSGGGAGIQADLKTFAAHGVYGTTALTCLTAQNPEGVSHVEQVSPDFLRHQLEAVDGYFNLGAIKTGMLFSADLIEEVAGFLQRREEAKGERISVVVDPVMVATSGAVLLQPEAITTLQERLFPFARLLTPNLDEAGVLLGDIPTSAHQMRLAADDLADRYGVAVLIKGGHLRGSTVVDILRLPEGTAVEMERPRVEGVNTHGSGCTLSSAIAAQLARGETLLAAVDKALEYLSCGMQQAALLREVRFINHAV